MDTRAFAIPVDAKGWPPAGQYNFVADVEREGEIIAKRVHVSCKVLPPRIGIGRSIAPWMTETVREPEPGEWECNMPIHLDFGRRFLITSDGERVPVEVVEWTREVIGSHKQSVTRCVGVEKPPKVLLPKRY